jgi:hypothetical protein
MKCLNPNCDRKQVRRGLCNSCYQMAWRLVAQGRTTWGLLEKAGKARGSPGRGKMEWFLER